MIQHPQHDAAGSAHGIRNGIPALGIQNYSQGTCDVSQQTVTRMAEATSLLDRRALLSVLGW